MSVMRLSNVRVWNTGERIDIIVPTALSVHGDTLSHATAQQGSSASASSADIEYDGSRLTLTPGFADPHVHFRDPGQQSKETMQTGALAAASGGYTHVLIMPNTMPALDGEPLHAATVPQSAAEAQGVREVLAAGCSSALEYVERYESVHGVQLPVNYALCVAASLGRHGKHLSNPAYWGQYADRARWVHPVVAISDDGAAVSASLLESALGLAQRYGIAFLEHCEHHDAGVMHEGATSRSLGVAGIPSATELAIVERDIAACRATGVPVHFQHVSTAQAFDAIRQARREGLPITCETAPHYLALCDEDVARLGTLAKMNPPLRSAADREATLEAVADGTVSMIATDHAPHTLQEKQQDLTHAPNGIIGLETAYGVCHKALVDTGIISNNRLIELMSVSPQRLMGYKPTDITALLSAQSASTSATAITGTTDITDTVGTAPTEPIEVIESMESIEHRSHVGRRVLDLTSYAEEQQAHINLTLLDEQASWQVDASQFHSKARNTPFDGVMLTGKPMGSIVRGHLAFSRL